MVVSGGRAVSTVSDRSRSVLLPALARASIATWWVHRRSCTRKLVVVFESARPKRQRCAKLRCIPQQRVRSATRLLRFSFVGTTMHHTHSVLSVPVPARLHPVSRRPRPRAYFYMNNYGGRAAHDLKMCLLPDLFICSPWSTPTDLTKITRNDDNGGPVPSRKKRNVKKKQGALRRNFFLFPRSWGTAMATTTTGAAAAGAAGSCP